jgi:hypothetical protein
MALPTDYQSPRANRFGGNVYSQYDIASGMELAQDTGIDRAFVKRNLRPYAKKYKPIRRAIKTNFRSLKGKNYAQLERIATMAVIKKAGVKRRKLRTKVNRRKLKRVAGGKRNIRIARRKLQQGYDIRKLGQQGLNIQDIKNKKVRAAARHLQNVRKNRAITKTPLRAGKGYDIRAGHISVGQARAANYWRKPKRRRRRRK